MSATLAGKKMVCFDIYLVLADRLINLADKIQNLSATLAGNNFELCLALIIMFLCQTLCYCYDNFMNKGKFIHLLFLIEVICP